MPAKSSGLRSLILPVTTEIAQTEGWTFGGW